MTEDELAALEEAAAQRTRIIGTWAEKDTVFVSTADAAFLESARAAVPALIAEVRRLRAVLIEERAYHIMFSNLSVLSWRDIPQDQIAMLREAAEVSLHVSTADLHDWLHDTER